MRYCVDWTERRHHLGGAVGRGVYDRMRELEDPTSSGPPGGAVTEAGVGGPARELGVRLDRG